MVAVEWRKANMRIKIKLQEAGEDEEVGNDNLVWREVIRGHRALSMER